MDTNYTTLKAAALKAAAKYTKETPAEEFARTHYRRMIEALEACEEEGISIEQAIEKYSSTRGAQDFIGLLQAALEEVEEVETVEVEVEATEQYPQHSLVNMILGNHEARKEILETIETVVSDYKDMKRGGIVFTVEDPSKAMLQALYNKGLAQEYHELVDSYLERLRENLPAMLMNEVGFHKKNCGVVVYLGCYDTPAIDECRSLCIERGISYVKTSTHTTDSIELENHIVDEIEERGMTVILAGIEDLHGFKEGKYAIDGKLYFASNADSLEELLVKL